MAMQFGDTKSVRARYASFGALAVACALATPGIALAQAAAPVTVTPQTLAPEKREKDFSVPLPRAGALAAPKGAEGLTVTLSKVAVEGTFPKLSAQTDRITAKLVGRKVTLAEIYAAASAIEAAHARAGYVLARVSVPPQKLEEGGALRLVVTDGFIEKIETAGLPGRVRSVVRRETARLANRPHLSMHDIEKALMLASDTPGLQLRSTLMRGEKQGGTKLILDGTQSPLSFDAGGDNAYDPSLATYGLHAELTLNSLLHQGEQIYGFVASGYDLTHAFADTAPAAIYGGGVLVRFASGRLSINPEVTASRTRPAPVVGAPRTVGWLKRQSLRASYTLDRTRATTAGISVAVERIDETNDAFDFGVLLSHDRYLVTRLGASYSTLLPSGFGWGLALRASQGLGNLAAITPAETTATSVGYSRQGSNNAFTHLNANLSLQWPVGKIARLSLLAKGQTSFGQALFRAEQFSLEGADGTSAYIGGVTTVDEGGAVRAELTVPRNLHLLRLDYGLTPYLFAAVGGGTLDRPTALEPGGFVASSLGAGTHVTISRTGLLLGVEYAHGFATYHPLNNADRVNLTLGLHL